MALSVDTLHTDGTRMACTSEYNGPGTTGLRIMAPTAPAPYAVEHIGHAIVIVCPVKPDDNTEFGDGFDTLVALNVHNVLSATLVAWETDGVEPYVADHPTHADLRYESFVIQLRDWVLANGSLATGNEPVWLVSFSKGGWSVLNLLLRHPDKFDFAGLYDPIIDKAQIQADSGIGSDFSGCAIGSEANYDAHYDVVANIAAHEAAFVGGPTRIWIAEGPAFGSPGNASNWTNLKAALASAGIPCVVRDDYWQGAAHHWSVYQAGVRTGWLQVAVDAAYQAMQARRFGTPGRWGAAVVPDYRVLVPFDAGTGDVEASGSDAPLDAAVSGDMAWDIHEFTGDPVFRVEGTAFLDFGFYTALGVGDKTIAAYMQWRVTAGGSQYGAIVDNEHDQGWSFFYEATALGALNYYASDGVFGVDPGVAGLMTGCWRHVVVTWDATANVARFYIDGIFNGQITLGSAAEGDANGPLVVNAIRSGSLFRGSTVWGEIRLYDRRLADDEIRLLFAPPLDAAVRPAPALTGGLLAMAGGLQ